MSLFDCVLHVCNFYHYYSQVWAYVKNYVALRWFEGRTMKQLRSQVLCGMYGIEGAGDVSQCWRQPKGLAPHTGLTPELAKKFILHSDKAINDFIDGCRYLKHMGSVGNWKQTAIDRLVLPTSGSMEEDELELVDDDMAEAIVSHDMTQNE